MLAQVYLLQGIPFFMKKMSVKLKSLYHVVGMAEGLCCHNKHTVMCTISPYLIGANSTLPFILPPSRRYCWLLNSYQYRLTPSPAVPILASMCHSQLNVMKQWKQVLIHWEKTLQWLSWGQYIQCSCFLWCCEPSKGQFPILILTSHINIDSINRNKAQAVLWITIKTSIPERFLSC